MARQYIVDGELGPIYVNELGGHDAVLVGLYSNEGAGGTTTTITPAEGAITLTGQVASIVFIIGALAGSISLDGNAPTITNQIQSVAGSVSVSGNTASVSSALSIQAKVVGLGHNRRNRIEVERQLAVRHRQEEEIIIHIIVQAITQGLIK